MRSDVILRESIKKSTKILAGKNVKVIMEGFAPRVAFNPKTKQPTEIVLPMLPDACPKPLVDAIRGYQDHEAYHVLYSSHDDICDGTKDKTWHYIHNCIDDNFINAKGAREFPGTHVEILNGYKYLFENMDAYKDEHIDAAFATNPKQAAAGYISSWIARKMNSDFSSRFYDESTLGNHFKSFDDKLTNELKEKLANCDTPEKVAELTTEMVTFLDEIKEELDKQAAAGDEGEGDKGEKGKGKGKGKGDDTSSKSEEVKPEDLPGSFEDALKSIIGQNIKIEFDKIDSPFFWSDRMNEVVSIDEYCTTLGSKVGAKTFSSDGLDEFDKSCKEVSNFLRKKLERLIESRNRVYYTGGYKSGKLTSKSLASVPLGNENVFSKKNDIRSINAAVGLLCDLSGSMNGQKVKLAAQSTYTMADCLSKLKVPFEALGFWTDSGITMDNREIHPAWGEFSKDLDKKTLERVVNTTSVDTTFVFKAFAENFGLKQKVALKAASKGSIGMCQNNDATHLRIALERLAVMPQEKKILFVFSDGQPAFHGACRSSCDSSRSMLKLLATNAYKDYGVTIVGIGIQSSAVTQFYENTKVIKELNELPTTVFEVLTAQLLNRK